MDKRIINLIEAFCATDGAEKVMKTCSNLRKKLDDGYLKEYPYIYLPCWFYVVPITKETKVMKGVILERYTRERHGDFYYRFLGEDGKIHNDFDDCVMKESKDIVETYLNELREDMIADGDL